MKRILLVSDAHGNKKTLDKILENNKDCDLKIYLGDFEMSELNQKSYSKIFDYVVLGNRDNQLKEIPEHIIINISDLKILITHGHLFQTNIDPIDFNKLFYFAKENEIDIIMHGHNHISHCGKLNEEIIRINPGSITFPMDEKKPSYGILTINSKEDIKFKSVFL